MLQNSVVGEYNVQYIPPSIVMNIPLLILLFCGRMGWYTAFHWFVTSVKKIGNSQRHNNDNRNWFIFLLTGQFASSSQCGPCRAVHVKTVSVWWALLEGWRYGVSICCWWQVDLVNGLNVFSQREWQDHCGSLSILTKYVSEPALC